MAASLPDGRKGQALALALTGLAAAVAWFGVVAPALDWYADRDASLRRALAMRHRMAALVETLPALRAAAEDAAETGVQPGALLAGATDPLAAAALQQKLDELAAAAGVRIGSEEILPARADGDFRAIAVRVTLTAPWRAFVGLLVAIAKSDVPMATDELQVRGPPGSTRDPDLPVDATFTATAYRAAKADGR